MMSRARIRRYLLRAEGTTHALIASRRLKWKIRKIRKQIDPQGIAAAEADESFTRAARRFLASHFPRDGALDWHLAYAAANGNRQAEYIPESIFYQRIEPAINPRIAASMYADKNHYDLLFSGIPLPTTLARTIEGKPYAHDYTPISSGELLEEVRRAGCDAIAKPSVDTGGGRNVRVLSRQELGELTPERFVGFLGENTIVQQLLRQHPALAEFHPASLNTLRIVTFRSPGGFVVLSSVLRMGVNRAQVDNQAAGGISCGIDADGRLKTVAYDKYFKRHSQHPTTGRPFEGFAVPSYAEACRMCLESHQRLPLFGMISWDVGIDSEGSPVLIEANLEWQEINFHQLNNGPLFGPHTREVLRMM